MEDQRIQSVYIALTAAAEAGDVTRDFESIALQYGAGFHVRRDEIRQVIGMTFSDVLQAVRRADAKHNPEPMHCPLCDEPIPPPRGGVSQMAEHFAREHPGHNEGIPLP